MSLESAASPPIPKRVFASWRDPERTLFAVLILLHLLPLWSFRYFPSQDGPAHLSNANILRTYDHPERTAFREYYTLNRRLEPNWLSHLALAGLMYLFPPLVAEKILLSGYIVLLPISVRYALRSVNPRGGFLAILSFPFVNNHLLHMGFYNFALSLPVFFLLLGAWIRRQARPGLKSGIAPTALALLLYFCHIFTFLMAVGALGLMAVALSAADLLARRSGGGEERAGSARSIAPRLLLTAGIFLPSLVLAALFLSARGGDVSSRPGAWVVLRGIAGLETLVSFDEREGAIAGALAALFAAVALYHLAAKLLRRDLRRWDLLFLLVAAFTVVAFLAPGRAAGGLFIIHRAILFPFFGLLLWLSAQEHRVHERAAVQIAAAALALLLLGLHAAKYSAVNDQIREYVSASGRIEPDSTVLPLPYAPFGRAPGGGRLSSRVAPFLHAGGYLAAERNLVDLDNYEANAGYFPTIFRPERNPFTHLSLMEHGLEKVPPCVDIIQFERRTGGTVDYVLLWGLNESHLQHPCTSLLLNQLEGLYDPIASSPGSGLMYLYRRK